MSMSIPKSIATLAVALAAFRVATRAHGQMAVYFVDDDAPPGGNGLSWDAAFHDLQDALDAFHKNGGSAEIDIAQGVYHPDRGTGNRATSFDVSVASGTVLNLFGGFAGIKAMFPGARDPAQYLTVLSGDLKGDDAGGFEHRDDNSGVLLAGDGGGDRWIDGVTVTGAGNEWSAQGAVDVVWGRLTLTRCGFEANHSRDGFGGAVHATVDSLTAVDCRFERNYARAGGAIMVDVGQCVLISCRFTANTATWLGGAVWNNGLPLVAVNCEFNGNVSQGEGGALMTMLGFLAENCSFVANRSGSWDSVVRSWAGAGLMRNCVIWDNKEVDGHFMVGATGLEFNCVQGGWPGEGNINADPRFRDPLGPDGLPGTGDEDLRLSTGSPCIDAASNANLPEDWFDLDADGDFYEPLSLDLAGNPRRIDDPLTPDSGIGPAPVVDMGAYEFQRSCAADLDADGLLTIFDFLAFVNLFNEGSPTADCDGSGSHDLFDFLCFSNAFSVGC